MDRKLKIAIVGLGSRGKDTYAPAIAQYGSQAEITAIADIIPEKVDEVAKKYHIPRKMCFSSAEELLEQERLADILFICTQDKQHVPHALPALRKGYHILLEKPISPSLEECREILRTAHEYDRKVVVCHVLRYTPFYKKLKEILDSDIIGEIMNVQAVENVGYFHQAHSFVRGNWRKEEETSPMILAKCCHDMDLLLWLTDKTCDSVSSFGELSYFRADKAPNGSAWRCLDGCRVKEDCPYDAEKIYITNEETGIAHGKNEWPNNVLSLHPDIESITRAVREGPYGRCVFHCDNNVVDHQIVNMRMTDGSTVSFTMCGFTKDVSRYTRIFGTLGEVYADMAANKITISLFGREPQIIDINELSSDFSGHGGGDARMVNEFLDMIRTDSRPSGSITSLDVSVESHFVALAAEASRLGNGKPVLIDDMRYS